MRRSFLVVITLAAAGCSRAPDESGGDAAKAPDESLDVYEAVLRIQLEGNRREWHVHLSIDNHDVPAELLDRLRKDWPNLHQVSEATTGREVHAYAKGLKWNGRDAADVWAGHRYRTQLTDERWVRHYRVVRKGGGWVAEPIFYEGDCW